MQDLSPYASMQNRELSWLRFNERVLLEAADETVPPLERLKYISIFTSNLDEFFMIRVGSIFDLQSLDPDSTDNKTGLHPADELERIYSAVRPLYEERERVYHAVREKLASFGVQLLRYSDVTKKEKEYLQEYYSSQIEPLLSPQVVDSHHPFPHLANGVLHVGMRLENRENGKKVFGVIPMPSLLSQIVFLPGSELRCLCTEEIVLAKVKHIFSSYTITDKCVFCVTRNADINPEDEAYEMKADFRMLMKELLKKRKRLAAVRLEIRESVSEEFKSYLCEKLSIKPEQVYTAKMPIHVDFCFQLAQKLTPEAAAQLLFSPYTPQRNAQIQKNETMAAQIERRDILLSYPYESMEPFLRLIRESANDPATRSIKITIYRLASRAKLIEYLCTAAENGVDVTTIIELRARFDEQNNIDWSERLEEAGCKVYYGFDDYKIHSKICLITRSDKNGIRYLSQIGTGNYNEKTAEQYTDLSLMTADQQIGADAQTFFNNMAIANLQGTYKRLLVAPYGLKSAILAMMDEEIQKGQEGRILLKINSLTDMDVILKLHEASFAGVNIELFIRGICCILPGIEGVTEHITVRSIVGRYLEHSRIYCFGSGENEKIYISSADFMTRNTERRVEVACPISDANVREKIHRLLEALSLDTQKARQMRSEGTYAHILVEETLVDSQAVLMRLAENNAAQAEKKERAGRGKLRDRIKMILHHRKKQ